MCTTIIVGEHATVDGSFLVARSADSSSLKAQHFVIHPAVTGQSGVYSCKAHGGVNDFSYPLPENAMRYTTVPNWKSQLHGAVGFSGLCRSAGFCLLLLGKRLHAGIKLPHESFHRLHLDADVVQLFFVLPLKALLVEAVGLKPKVVAVGLDDRRAGLGIFFAHIGNH